MTDKVDSLKDILDSSAVELTAGIFDAIQGFPLGTLILSTFKAGVGITDYLLFKRFARFLNPIKGRDKDVKDYLDTLTPKRKEKLVEYLLSLLSKADSDEKARIMGFIFKAAVDQQLGYEMMLILVSIVERSFVSDLRHLPDYVQPSTDFTVASNEFINLGLIDNETGGYWKDQPTVQLNGIGKNLLRILNDEGWFKET